MFYNIKVGSLATAIPVIHYLLRGKWWTDKRRESLRELTAFILFRSINFGLHLEFLPAESLQNNGATDPFK